MKLRKVGWTIALLSPLGVSLACAGTSLNDVGDLSTADAGGEAGSTGSTPEPSAAGMAGNLAGTGGTSTAPDPVVAGAGGADVTGCEDCIVIVDNRDVRDIAVTNDKVYWVEYGTVEQGIHAEDGRVMARDLDGGPNEVLADEQFGPFSIGVSAQNAYVARHAGANDAELFRLPLSGGAEELLMPVDRLAWPFDHWFVAAPGQVFVVPSAGYRILEAPGSQPEQVLEYAAEVAGDDTALYARDDDGVITKVPFGTGTPETLDVFGAVSRFNSYGKIAVTDEFIYAIEIDNGDPSDAPGVHYLGRAPKTGGSWKRLARLAVGPSSGRVELKLQGESFYFNSSTDSARGITQGSLEDPTAQTAIVSLPAGPGGLGYRWQAWAVARTGVFFADEGSLRFRAAED